MEKRQGLKYTQNIFIITGIFIASVTVVSIGQIVKIQGNRVEKANG